jgi:hypothetical protein
MAEHTATPWKQHPGFFTSMYSGDKQVAITGGPTVDVKNIHEREANARFIVKACNHFDEMLETLKEAKTELFAAKMREATDWGADLTKAQEFANGHPIVHKIAALLARIEGET